MCTKDPLFSTGDPGWSIRFLYKLWCFFGNSMLVKYGQELRLSRICLLLFLLITKITSVALIEIMFLFNKKIFFFFFWIFSFIISSCTLSLRTTFLFWRWLSWPLGTLPPYNTYVQTITGSITRHHLTYVCNIIYYFHSLLVCLGSSQLSSTIYKDLLSHVPLTRQARPRAL